MKLIYKDFNLDILEAKQEPSISNSGYIYNNYMYSFSSSNYAYNFCNVLPRNILICMSKDPETVKGLIDEFNKKEEQEALIRLADGDYKINHVFLDQIDTNLSLDGQFNSRIVFYYSDIEYVQGSKLGFFKEQ